jgi:hypothetical protein
MSRLYVCILVDIFTTIITIETFFIFYRNFIFHQRFFRAKTKQIQEVIQLKLKLSRSIQVRSEDYINIWVSDLDLRSLLQTHSFMIISWRHNEDRIMTIHILIESRSDFINQLSQISFNKNHEFLTLFSDSHEITIFMNDFESIFMFVTDIDIATQLSYLRNSLRNTINAEFEHVVFIWYDNCRISISQETYNNECCWYCRSRVHRSNHYQWDSERR